MELLTFQQAYQVLNKAIGLNQLRRLMNTGEIESFLIGNKLMTTRQNLDRFISRSAKANSTSRVYETKQVYAR